MSAELEKVRAETKRKQERAERLAQESEKQSQGQTDKVSNRTYGGIYMYNVMYILNQSGNLLVYHY